MKNYFLGLAAIVIALSAVAFKSAKVTKDFVFQGSTTSQSAVNAPANWQEATLSCDATNHQACGLQTVSDAYYHFDSGLSKYILNDQTYVNGHPGTSVMSISSTLVFGGSTYYVTSASNGTIKNKS